MDVGLGPARKRSSGISRGGVLILVLVDVGLGRVKNAVERIVRVLILVLVDVGLGHATSVSLASSVASGLNPCFSGCWSRTA